MSISRAVRRGATTAIHSDVQILHPAAVQDFLQRIRELIADGDLATAEGLWSSVFEVVHMPPPYMPVQEFAELPPMRRVPCSVADCQRCTYHLGGYRFPWVGNWTRQSALVRVEQAWFDYRESEAKIDLLALERLASGYRIEDLIPREWEPVGG